MRCTRSKLAVTLVCSILLFGQSAFSQQEPAPEADNGAAEPDLAPESLGESGAEVEAEGSGEGEAEGEVPQTEEAGDEGDAEPQGQSIVEPQLTSEPEREAEPAGDRVVEPRLQQGHSPEEAEDDDAEPGEEESEGGRTRRGVEETWSDALPFRNTFLTYENIFNAYQLNRGAEQTFNPYYAMSLSMQPRWYFRDELSIRLRFDLEVELTNADDTTDYHETRVSDLSVDLVYNPFVTIPGIGVDVGAGFRLQFPTSLQSQAETRYLGLGPDLRLAKVFDVADGLVIGYTFRYMKYLNRYTTMERDTNPYVCTTAQPDCLAHHQLGDPSRSHGFFNSILLQLDFARRLRPMHIGLSIIFMNYLTYELPEATVDIMGDQEVVVEHIDDPQRHSASIWYVLEFGVELTDYVGLSLGASTLSPQLAPDSTYRTPFFNRYTNVYLDLSLDIERLVAAVRR